jgi:hypothetical protein
MPQIYKEPFPHIIFFLKVLFIAASRNSIRFAKEIIGEKTENS